MKRKRHIVDYPFFWVLVSLALGVINAHNIGRYYAEDKMFNCALSAAAAIVALIPAIRFTYDILCMFFWLMAKRKLEREIALLQKQHRENLEELRKSSKENEK